MQKKPILIVVSIVVMSYVGTFAMVLSLSYQNSTFQPSLQIPQDIDEREVDFSRIQPIDPEVSIKEGKPVPQAHGDVVIVFPRGIATLEPKQTPFPAMLLITVGDTVTWKNEDIQVHTVTSGFPQQEEFVGKIFDSQLISPDSSFSHTFSDPDTSVHHKFVGYSYFCSVHPWMTGGITVQIVEK